MIKQFVGPCGTTLACVQEREAAFLYQKIFVEEEYGNVLNTKSDLILDIGGNIGAFAKYAAMKCGPGSEIWSFEPMPPLVECLRLNTRPQDKVFGVAISDTASKVELEYLPNYTLLSGSKASSYMESYKKADRTNADADIDTAFIAQRFEVSALPLSEICRPLVESGRRISLLKIDCEQMEAKVVDGVGDDVWKIIDAVVLEVHDVGDRIETIQEKLESKNFSVTIGNLAPPCFLLGEGSTSQELNTCLMTAHINRY